MITRRHFEAIANILNKANAKFGLVSDMADYFDSVNNNFDRARFYKTCGYGEM